MPASELLTEARLAYDAGVPWKRFIPDEAFCSVERDLAYSIENWSDWAWPLLDHESWRLDRLVGEDGFKRKPRACLQATITWKDNLAVVWYPNHSFIGRYTAENDFRYWSDMSIPFEGPPNRIIFIHRFRDLLIGDFARLEKPYLRPEQLLIEAVKVHLDEVAEAISNTIDLRVLNRLELAYSGGKHARLQAVELGSWGEAT